MPTTYELLVPFITVATVMGGFAFNAFVQLINCSDRRRIVTLASVTFALTSLGFIGADIGFVLGATARNKGAGFTACMHLLILSLLLLLAGVALAAWSRSKSAGILTTLGVLFTYFFLAGVLDYAVR